MSRTAVYRQKSGALDPIQVWTDNPVHEDVDDAVIDHDQGSSARDFISARQYVVYSPTFRVPAFYFTMHDSRTCLRLGMARPSVNLLQRDDHFRWTTS